MAKQSIPLKNLHIASPCQADWQKMVGSESVRFCGDCKLNVYNISQLTTQQAEDLIRQTEGHLCVRYFKRADGTVLVQDCPVGWQAVKKRFAQVATATASALLTFFGGLSIYNYFHPLASFTKSINSCNVAPQSKPPICSTPKTKDKTPPGEWMLGSPMPLPGEVPPAPPVEPVAPVAPVTPIEPVAPMMPVLPSIVRRSEGVIRGNAINRVMPTYPALAKAAHIEGDVVVEIFIDGQGKVLSSRVISGHPLLQQAAVSAARQWEFRSTTLEGQPVKVSGILTFRFKL